MARRCVVRVFDVVVVDDGVIIVVDEFDGVNGIVIIIIFDEYVVIIGGVDVDLVGDVDDDVGGLDE